MRRLLKLLRKTDAFAREIPQTFIDKLQKLELAPGECVPRDHPVGWIFIEEGFLLLMKWREQRWVCVNRTTKNILEEITRPSLIQGRS